MHMQMVCTWDIKMQEGEKEKKKKSKSKMKNGSSKKRRIQTLSKIKNDHILIVARTATPRIIFSFRQKKEKKHFNAPNDPAWTKLDVKNMTIMFPLKLPYALARMPVPQADGLVIRGRDETARGGIE